MATLNQVARGARKKLFRKGLRYLHGQPQVAATVVNTLKLSPKKPNSANRSFARVRTHFNDTFFTFIPGEKHSLQPHSKVLVRGCNRKDIIGGCYAAVRGHLDLAGVAGRRSARSRYGAKRTPEGHTRTF